MRAGSGIPPARAPAQFTKGEGYGSDRSREGPHPSSEDDVAQERLGWRGQKDRPRPAMMTEESKKETSPDLDPGHTS